MNRVVSMWKVCGMLLVGLWFGACAQSPQIDSISPESGPPGTVVTIEGNLFGDEQGSSLVSFGGVTVPTTGILAWSQTQVQARVPANARTGPLQIVRDGLWFSNDDHIFTVSGDGPDDLSGAFGLAVANRTTPGIEVFRQNAGESLKRLGEIDLSVPGHDIEVRNLAVTWAHGKVYATVSRTPAAGGETLTELVMFAASSEGFTAPTIVQAGVEPTGLKMTPDGEFLVIASTVSSTLTVLSTANDLVEQDIFIDLAAWSYGFEPLSVEILPSPDVARYGDFLLSVIGNNFYTMTDASRGEVLTFAPAATDDTEVFVSSALIENVLLNGSVAVYPGWPRLWLLGESDGVPGVAYVDAASGELIDYAAFSDDDTGIPAEVTAPVTSATSVAVEFADYADWSRNGLLVTLPDAGVLRFAQALPAVDPYTEVVRFNGAPTAAVERSIPASLLSVGDRPTQLATLRNREGIDLGVLVNHSAGAGVSLIQEETVSPFVDTVTGPTRMGATLVGGAALGAP